MKQIIGIDISKHELFIYANDSYFSISNDEKSLDKWCEAHAELAQTALFVYEATGGYEKVLGYYLKSKGYKGHRVHANHVRSYAKAMGILAKTDKIDAKVIHDFARMKVLEEKESIMENEALLALVQRREQLQEQIKQENNRLETLGVKAVIKDIEGHVRHLKSRLKKIEASISQYISERTEMKNEVERMCSIPGVGLITSVSVLAYLPEITEPKTEAKSLICLSGLAPMNKDSGKKTGKRKIQGGRAQIRRVLYMAVLSAKRCNSVIKEFFDRLRSKGKPFKVVMTAAMRKLLTIIRSVIVRSSPWEDNWIKGTSVAKTE